MAVEVSLVEGETKELPLDEGLEEGERDVRLVSVSEGDGVSEPEGRLRLGEGEEECEDEDEIVIPGDCVREPRDDADTDLQPVEEAV